MTLPPARRVAVTGALGKLGRFVVAELRAHGIAVVAIDRATAATAGGADAAATNDAERANADGDNAPARPTDASGAPFVVHHAELTDAAAADAALEGCDALIHLAAITDPVSRPASEMLANNVASTFNLLDAAARRGLARVVLASSQSVLGHPWAPRLLPLDYVPVDEDHPARPVDPYALSKQLCEAMAAYHAHARGLMVCSMRFPSVWLPEQFPWRPTVRLTELEQAAKSMWAYVDVRDAARACRLAMQRSWTGHALLNITARWAIGIKPVRALLAEWYPATTDIRAELGDDTAVFDWHRAERVLGFRARYRWLPDGIHDMGDDDVAVAAGHARPGVAS
ncbi:MAG: NAD(P)-dependent oxidoreductase [Gemmatimonadetes bacterium]|nr:NAD(P)-dependent oxidoreductase [Gemmatimonadota bacterium]